MIRAPSMRPALSFGTTAKELIRHCFLRRQVESLLPRFWRGCRLLEAFSFNLRILLANGPGLRVKRHDDARPIALAIHVDSPHGRARALGTGDHRLSPIHRQL